MPLTGKYLKYSPEITLEIFTLVWNKLIQCGWRESVYSGDIEYRFMEFKGGEHLYNDEDDAKSFYVNYKNIQECIKRSGLALTETTVQEILGYNPFVKDDFVLPKKWCIKSQSRDQDYLINKFARSCGGGHWNDENNYARNNYLNISDGEYHRGSRTLDKEFTEITFDQFKKYVLKDHIETSKETNPEYVECINAATCNTKVGEIFKCRCSDGYFEWEYNNKSMRGYNSWDGWSVPWSDKLPQKHFKSSTKEAFNAQNQPKSIGLNKFPTEGHCKTDSIELRKHLTKRPNTKISGEPKWIEGKNIGVGWNEFSHWVISEKSSKPEYSLDQLSKFLDYSEEKPKEPLKQAVHCTTQEEWYFANDIHQSSLKAYFKDFKDKTVLRLDSKNAYGDILWAKTNGYQILSFQEWCDLNGYKMEKEVKFEVGDIVELKAKNTGNGLPYNLDSVITELLEIDHNKCASGNLKDDSHFMVYYNGKYFRTNKKWIIRHATPEEINNHLISIGQIPAGEPLNTGIEPNKDGGYGCISANREGNPQCTFNSIKINGQEILKPKMILSIDDEELPMVSIIKTNTIKQLLNND